MVQPFQRASGPLWRSGIRMMLPLGFLLFSSCGPASDQSEVIQPNGSGQSEREALPDDPTTEALNPATASDLERMASEIRGEFTEPSAELKAQSLERYSYVDPTGLVPRVLLDRALAYYNANSSRLANPNALTVVDFSASSAQSRMFIINMSTGFVWALHVAHGKGSDRNGDGYAESFSNQPGSNASSLGFYRTAETYYGGNGYSLRIDGLSATNSNARSRLVVVHGSNYVREADVIQGRSWGCFALMMSLTREAIDQVKGGSLIYAGLSQEQ